LLGAGVQVNPVDEFSPAQDLSNPTFDAGEGGLVALGVFQALSEHVLGQKEPVVKQWGDGRVMQEAMSMVQSVFVGAKVFESFLEKGF